MQNELDLYDITIVGGGPAGLFAAFYSGMRSMKTKLIEASPYLGGKLNSYPDKMIWDVGGQPPIKAKQLARQLIEQAMTFDPTIVLNQQIQDIKRTREGYYIIQSRTGECHLTRTIVLSIGYGAKSAIKLSVKDADKYENSNLHYTVTDLKQYKGKRVLISGGGDSAVDFANALYGIAHDVMVVHRRNEFKGHERSVETLLTNRIRVKMPFAVKRLEGDQARINAVEIDQVDEKGVFLNRCEHVKVDAVIVNHGMKADIGGIRNWGLKTDDRHILVNDKLETGKEGIYAAGDSAMFGNKIHLLAGAFTDAATAVNHAKTYIKPESAMDIFISSHNPVFDEKNELIEQAAK